MGLLRDISPIAGAAIDAIGSVGGGLFSANQARKNRAFQERMYKQQVADNRENWRMQVEYSDPSNERARIEKAGLNPLLMYGQGGLMSTVSTPQGGTAPSGDSAKGSFNTNFGQAMYQSAMMQAQIRNLESVTEKNETEAQESRARTAATEYDTMFRRLCQNVELALKWDNHDALRSSVRELDDRVIQRGFMNAETAATMAQARLYEIKRFNLDYENITTALEQRWREIANGRIAANAQLKAACASWLNAVTNQQEARWRIGKLAFEIYKDSELLPYQKRALNLDNVLKQVGIKSGNLDNMLKFQRFENIDYMGSGEVSPMLAPIFLFSGNLFGRKPYSER